MMPSQSPERALSAVARGDQPADRVLRGATFANVYTGELLDNWGVAIAGERIAYVGPDLDSAIGPATEVIDCRGQVLAPGFIDAHTHLDCLLRLDRYLAGAIPTGITSLITETAEISNVGGAAAVAAFLSALPRLPISVWATAPTISYLCSDRGDGHPMISWEEMAELLEEPSIVGLGEIYWPALLAPDAPLSALLAKADSLGKTAEGHTAGARDRKLAACVAAGLSSCHEPITPEEVRARLRLGLYTIIRDGSVRRDFPALEGALTGMQARRLILASDTVWPHDLEARGYLDDTARQAVKMGLSPIDALRAMTLTPAEHFGLDSRVGGLAPGRQADMVLLPHFEEFRPSLVIAHGRIVARDGALSVDVPAPRLDSVLPSPRAPRPLTPDDLAIAAPSPVARIRAIRFTGDVVTQPDLRTVAAREGRVEADPASDLLKVIALDRFGAGRIARGMLAGFGLSTGAVAASVSFDTANLIAVGANDADLLCALERMLALGGGMVVVANGAVRAELPLPLGGIMSSAPLADAAAGIRACEAALQELGCTHDKPFLAVQVLSFTAIPSLRIRERGLWDVRRQQVVSLFVGEGEA